MKTKWNISEEAKYLWVNKSFEQFIIDFQLIFSRPTSELYEMI